jgi:hypothetical protein
MNCPTTDLVFTPPTSAEWWGHATTDKNTRIAHGAGGCSPQVGAGPRSGPDRPGEFLLDYEEEEDEEETGSRRRKKPWRYRWPDDYRDEVLARLLELNKQRADLEALAGRAAGGSTKRTARKRGQQPGPHLPGMS